jgi:hypothetical protein
MLVGYNTNVPYKGIVYHVQTEDSGLQKPVVITLLYNKGTILASKKTSYADIANSPSYKERVREIMQEQHKSMIRGLLHGDFTGDDVPEKKVEGPKPEVAETQQPEAPEKKGAEPKGQISKSLDDILIDFIIKRGD